MDEAFQLNSHLHYGAIVHISCFKEKTNFYLYSNGISFKSIITLAANDGPTEASKALFKITPIIKFQSEEFLEKLLKERYEWEEGTKVSEEQIKVFIDQFEFELGENNSLIEQQRRYPIRYNDDFMLQHLYSSKYLTYTKNDKTNEYMLELLEIPTKFSTFNLETCFNYQKDINVYIPFNSAAYLNIKIYEGLEIKDYYLNFKKDSIFDSWTTSEEEKQPISIGLYQTAEEMEYKDICYGDTVWIFHLESGSFVKLEETKQVESFILKKINFALGRIKNDDEMREERGIGDPLASQIFLQKTENETSAQKYGLWKIIYACEKASNVINRKEHLDRFKGGRVRFDQEVRFYNIRHRVYLSVRKIKEKDGRYNRQKYHYVLATQKSEEDNTAFRIKSLSPNSIYATTEDLFLIQHVLYETYLTLQQPFGVNETRARLSPKLQFKKEDNFKFTKIEFIQEWQNNNILSTMPFLKEGLRVFQENESLISAREEVLLQLLVQNLIELLSFSYDLTEGFEASTNKLGKMTYNHYQVQKLLKDQGVIAQLIRILRQINPGLIQSLIDKQGVDKFKIKGSLRIVKAFSSQLLSDKKNIALQPQLVKKVVNLCFKVLRNCCKSNNQNSLLLFGEMEVFAKYLALDTYAEQFFIDAFAKPVILDKMSSTQFALISDQYLNIFRHTRRHNHHFFSLLVRFFEYEGEPIGKNQLEAYRLAIEQRSPLLLPLDAHDDFLVTFEGRRYELTEFGERFPREREVMAAQINFFAYLTFGRNYVCSNTIKELFPLPLLLRYIQSDICASFKASLINVFTHAYLNERPRFPRRSQKVFPLYGVQDRESFKRSLASAQPERQRSGGFEYEMREMQSSGLSAAGIQQILSCVSHHNHISEQELRGMSGWLLGYIRDRIGQSNELFYREDIEAALTCTHVMIELGVVGVGADSGIVELITSIVKRISESLQLQNEVKIQLRETNFKQLLLEMVEKNVIKRFNYSAKFDGLEDEVTPQNICSQYVNYAFYQNILLLEKGGNAQRKQSVRVIASVLRLISLFNRLSIEQKMEQFLGQVVGEEALLRQEGIRRQRVTQIMTQRVLSQPMKGKQDILRLLLLLFYNNNTFNINYASIQLLSNQLFAQKEFIESLQKIIFITEPEEQAKLDKLMRVYQEVRLMTETSEIWLNSNYESISYQYNSVILYFIDRLRVTLRLVVPPFREERWTPFDCLAGLEGSVNLERQTILSNIDFEAEVMSMLKSYRHYLVKLTALTRTNQLFVRMFQYCLVCLYVFIYNCPENKKKLEDHVQDIPVSEYFLKLCPIQLGQSRFLVEWLKDNYEECLDFYGRYNQTLGKFNKYTETYSRLLLTLLNYYGEPIQANLKKFFINIFDFNSFKEFLWLREGREFSLDLQQLLQPDLQPYFYHINAIDALLYLDDHLAQSTNTIKNHVRKSLSQEYLFSLLGADDYFTRENSLKPLLKVQIMFKQRIAKLITRIYLHQASPALEKYLKRQQLLFNAFLGEAAARLETEDYRKMIILKDVKQQEHTRVDFRLTQLFTITFGDKFLLQYHMQTVLLMAEAVIRSENCLAYHGVAESVYEQVQELNEVLHSSARLAKQAVVYPIPNQLNFKLVDPKKTVEFQRKKYFMSIILQTTYTPAIYEVVEHNQITAVKLLKKLLQQINLKQFLFFRKISEFLEDAFQKLPQDSCGEVNRTLSRLMSILRLFIRSEAGEKANEVRHLMGKSELVFPILNYFETAVMNVANRKLFLTSLQYVNELLGDDGNRMIQTIFNSYFTNKSDSIDFFMKIKQILLEINFQQTALYKCRRLYDGIESYYNNTRSQKETQFILLTFFINLCKGNFNANQLFLGSLANTSNFNITRAIWEILKYQSQKYTDHLVNVQNYYRITQCLSTIRQLVEGPCLENQNKFLKRDFFLTVLSYLQYESNNRNLELEAPLEQQLSQISQVSAHVAQKLRVYLNQDKLTEDWMPSQVKYRCISLISSLMSENSNDKSISELQTIPAQLLVRELDLVHQRYQATKLEYKKEHLQFTEKEEVVLPLGFKIYQVLQYYPRHQLPQNSPGLDFFKENSRIVEVMHQNLTIVVFPKIETEISQAFKAEFLESADRTSINSKLRDLQNAEIQNRQSDYPYGYILFFFTLLLVLFDLIIYVPDTLPFVQNLRFYSIFLSYGYFSVLEPLRAATLFLIVILSGVFLYLQIRGAVYMQQTCQEIYDSDDSRFVKIKRLGSLFLSNLDYLHYFFTMLLAIFGIFNPLFDSLVLVLELFRRSETFFIILKAIKETMDQLCVVLLINLILTYILTSILYFYYGNTQYSANCATLYYCFIFSLSIGFKADAGFVGMYDEDHLAVNYETVTFSDVLINFSYLFIIKVIMDQVIGAIIVDKFAQIREEKESLEEDENKFCFICGLQRNTLDRQEDGFEKHKAEYHVIWNYMEFLIHIKESKLGNLTGIERFVYDQQKSGKLNWFPINRSFHLESKKHTEEQEAVSRQVELENLKKMLDGQVHDINQHLSQMQDIINLKTLKEKKKEDLKDRQK